MAHFWIWWILAALLIGLELATGTFYLLAVGIAFGLGGVAAWLGAALPMQMLIGGALSAMQLARSAAIGEPEALAWTAVQLGKLYWTHGRMAAAAREYRKALVEFRGYVYAFDALAQVEWARGHLRTAIALEQRAVDAVPLPPFVAALGEQEQQWGDGGWK